MSFTADDLGFLTATPPGGVQPGDYVPVVRPDGSTPGLYQVPVPVPGVGPEGPPGAASTVPGPAGAPGVAAVPSAGNTVLSMSAAGLVYGYDGAVGCWIKVADMLDSFGQRLSDPNVPAAAPAALTDGFWVDQGGASDVRMTFAQLKALIGGPGSGVVAPAIVLAAPAAPVAGTAYAVSGTLAGYAGAPILAYSVDGEAFVLLPGDAVVESGSFVFAGPELAAGAHTLRVRDGNGVLSGSVAYTVLPAAMPASPGPALTITGATFAPGKFGQALTGGSAVSSAVLAMPAGARTYETCFQAADLPTNGLTLVTADHTILAEGLIVLGSGVVQALLGYSITGTTNVCDGAWHHIALSVDGDGAGILFVDGAVEGARPFTLAAYSNVIEINLAAYGHVPHGNHDEVRISTVARYAAAFTPPVAAFVSDGDTLALWHLDGDGLAS